jgi:hypothetical protein
MLNSKSNQNYTLLYIIGFIIIFYLFIMPYFDKNISPSPTPTFTEPSNMTTHQVQSNMTTHQVQPNMTTTYNVEPKTIQINSNSNNNIKKYDPQLINNELLDTQEYTNEHIKLFDKEYKPIEKLENINREIQSNPTSIPIENNLKGTTKKVHYDDIPKIDMNECKKSCCKHNQWLPPFMTEEPTNDYVGSNFSCNFGSGSGCVCITNNDLNFLTNRGFIK